MQHPQYFFRLALPILLVIAMAEAIWMLRHQLSYPWRQTGVTAIIALGQSASAALFGGGVTAALSWVWGHRLLTIPFDHAWTWLALFVGVEFCYYWFHRASHVCRWFWATHVVHHTPERMVLSGAIRLGWTSAISGAFGFYVPLVWLGFAPQAVFGVLAANLLYQYWLHTELVPTLGPLEWVFNTPSHHRVHHARNTEYLDANFGGVLIVFDRLFGTFVAENADNPCDYGLVKPIGSEHPLRIALGEWIAIGRDLRHPGSIRNALGYLFGAPGWSPDGSGQTTANIRAQSAVAKTASHRPIAIAAPVAHDAH